MPGIVEERHALGITGAVAEAAFAPPVTTHFTDHGGPILTGVQVQLIFWGSAWSGSVTPSAAAVTGAVTSILAGPYTTALYQYRRIRRGALNGTPYVDNSDPPNPFSDDDVEKFIERLVTHGKIPAPSTSSQLLYCVIMPKGVMSSGGSFIGEHNSFPLSGVNAHYAWVTNDGTLDFVTVIFSHELVESCSDPEGSAVLGDAGVCKQPGWCEIGDVPSRTDVVNGVRVQSYWSQWNLASVIPAQGRLPDKVTLQDTARGAPAFANVNDTSLALAWTGTDAAHHLNVMTSPDGHSFGGKVTLGETSIDGPGFAFGNGRAFLGWTGTDSGHHLNVISSADCHTFGNKVTLGETSPGGPALAFGNGRLFIAWNGTDTAHSLNVMSSTDGVHFGNKVTLAEKSFVSPGLTFLNGKLYLLWSGEDSNRSLNVLESTDGVNFTNKVTLGDSSFFAPALAQQGSLLLAWTGRGGAHLNMLASVTDTHGFTSKLTADDQGAAAPALANFKGQLFIGWTGVDSAHHLNVAILA
jgi:hypothetical protein